MKKMGLFAGAALAVAMVFLAVRTEATAERHMSSTRIVTQAPDVDLDTGLGAADTGL